MAWRDVLEFVSLFIDPSFNLNRKITTIVDLECLYGIIIGSLGFLYPLGINLNWKCLSIY